MESRTPSEESQPEEYPEQIPEQEQDQKTLSLSRAFGGQSIVRDIVETLLLTLIIFLVVNTLTGRYQVRGSSMETSLHSGQYLIVSKVHYLLSEPQRGDIVVFEPPNGSYEDYIKRIIGLPGETVEAREGSIWIDGYQMEEPYAARIPYSGTWVLEPGEYFVLGDNRPNSSDSHTWGVLPEENIVGKAWLCYWPPQYWGSVPHHEFDTPSQ